MERVFPIAVPVAGEVEATGWRLELHSGGQGSGGLESVLHEQAEVVTLVEDLAPHLRVPLAETADLAVLLRDQLLVEGRDLDVLVVRGKVEVGGEPLGDVALGVPVDVEGARLVVPFDLVEVEKPSELPFGIVGKGDGLTAGSPVAVLPAGMLDRSTPPFTRRLEGRLGPLPTEPPSNGVAARRRRLPVRPFLLSPAAGAPRPSPAGRR
jgi:hypothetical protein